MTRHAAAALVALCAVLAGCSGAPVAKPAPTWRAAVAHNEQGIRAAAAGEGGAALAEFSDALRLHTLLDNSEGMAVALINSARVHRQQGDLSSALASVERAAALLREPGELADELFFEKAKVLLARGELPAAREWALKAAQGQGGRARALNLAALVSQRQGLAREAREEGAAALALSRQEGVAEEEANALRLLGELALSAGDGAGAAADFSGALAIDRRSGSARKVAADLRGLGECAARRQATAEAVEFYNLAKEVALAAGERAAAAADMARLAELHKPADPLMAARLEKERERLLAGAGKEHGGSRSPTITGK